MGIGSLRQGAQKVSQNSSSNKGGKGGFFNKLRIPKLTPQLSGMLRPNENPGDPIMLVKPDVPYDDLYDVDDAGNWKGTKGDALHVVIHQVQTVANGKKKYSDFPCTAGPNRHTPQPCVGCSQADAGNKSVSNGRQQWAFNVKHLVPYHEIPLVDRKTSQIVMKKDKNEPVMVMEVCRNGTPAERLYAQQNRLNCEPCQRGIPVIYGAPKAYILGKNHLEELLKVDQHLEQTCANCMTRLIKVAFDCSRCGNEILNLANTQFVNEQLAQFAASPQQCREMRDPTGAVHPACGFVGLPKPAYECGFDPNGMYKVPNGCPDGVEPRPLSIFDCVFYVHKEGEDTQSKLVVSPPIPIQHFRTLTGNADLVQWLKQPHLARTFNLQDMFKPVGPDEQAKICGVPNPYAAQQPQYQQYPGAPQQGFAPGQYGGQQAPQQQQVQPQMPPQQPFPGQQQGQYGQPVPGFPPQNPQWGQQPVQPQGGPPVQPQGVPFSGRPNFGK